MFRVREQNAIIVHLHNLISNENYIFSLQYMRVVHTQYVTTEINTHIILYPTHLHIKNDGN